MKSRLLLTLAFGISVITLLSFNRANIKTRHSFAKKVHARYFIPDTTCNLSDSAYFAGYTFDTSYELYTNAPSAPANIVKVNDGTRYYYATGNIYSGGLHSLLRYNVKVYAGCDSTTTVIYTGTGYVSM